MADPVLASCTVAGGAAVELKLASAWLKASRTDTVRETKLPPATTVGAEGVTVREPMLTRKLCVLTTPVGFVGDGLGHRVDSGRVDGVGVLLQAQLHRHGGSPPTNSR